MKKTPTMRIEELSVGDWVCAKLAKWESDDADITPPLQVKRIDGIERHNLYVDLFNPSNNTIEHSAFVADLIPIPLTPEILEKNGFCPPPKYCGYYHLTVGNKEVFVCIYNDFSEFSHYSKGFVSDEECLNKLEISHLMSVHELQHALRLAGIEKKIEV